MDIKRTTLATAVLAACAMGVSGQAAAEAYAGAYLGVTNLVVGLTPQTLPNSYTFGLTNSATLNGNAVISSPSCGGVPDGATTCSTTGDVLGGTSNPGTVVNAPGGTVTRSNTDWSLLGPNATDTYANSNSVIHTAELVNSTFNADGTVNTLVPTSGETVAEAQVVGTGHGSANTVVTGTTHLTFTFTTPTTGAVSLSFDASPYVQTALNTPNLLLASGLAKITAQFLLDGSSSSATTSGIHAEYTPSATTTGETGLGGNITKCAGGITCSDTAAFSLNDTENLTPPSPSLPAAYTGNGTGSGLFSFDVGNLPAGSYTLNLSMLSNVDVQQTVPDPATPALMALGLVVMGATLRRRQMKGRRQNKA